MHQTWKGTGLLPLVMVGWILAFLGVPAVTWSAPKAVPQNLQPPVFQNITGQPSGGATSTSSTSSTASSTAASSDTVCAKDAALIFTGDISISASGDLSQLAGKCAIEGDLTITSDLQNLDGLASIEHVTGSLNVTGNSSLTSVSGLRNLKTVGGVLWITDNDTLANIGGMDALLKTGGLVIEGNPSLTSIFGFKALRKVTDNLLAINDNDKLTSIMGFGALVAIDKDLNIYGNAALTTLNTLNALRSVGGNFKIWENTALVHIAGFKSLMSAGSGQSDSFYLAKNTALTGVSGLTALGSVQNLTIQYNSLYPSNAAECLASQLTVQYYKLISYNGTATTDACARTPVTNTPTATQTFTGTGTHTGTATRTGTGRGTETSTTTATGTGSDTSTGTGTASATATGTGTGLTTAEIDFTAGKIPDGVTNVGCELADGSLQLGKNADGTFVEECYVDIAVSGDQDSGKMIQLDATRMDLMVDGDFSQYASDDVGLYAPTNDANKSELTTGKWFSNAKNRTVSPAVVNNSGDNDVVIASNGSLMQILPIGVGQNIKISFDADVSALNSKTKDVDGVETVVDQLFYLSMAFFDKDFKKLNFLYPIDDSTKSSLVNFKFYALNRGAFNDSLVIRGLDCNQHVKYNGDGISNEKTYFNMCEDSSGNKLTNEDGKTYSVDDIAYVSFEMAANWDGTGTTTLKSISADPLDQFTIALLDQNGMILQVSDNSEELYLQSFSGSGTVRVYLKSLAGNKTPTLKKLSLDDNRVARVTTGDKEATFTKPRMGFTGAITPVQEWLDRSELRSLCLDIFNNDEPLNCLEFFGKYDFARLRYNIPLMHFKTTKTGSNYQHEFQRGAYDDKAEPETLLRHFEQAKSYGIEPLLIIDHANCEGTYWFGESQNCYWDASGNLNDEFDLTTSDADNNENSMALMADLAKFIVTQFDGNHDYTYADGTTAKIVKLDNYEIGVETNAGEPIWKDNLTDAEEAKFLSDMAIAVKSINPDVHVETSITAHNAPADYFAETFHYDYIEDVLAPALALDPTAYTHFNFNPFNANSDVLPEDWLQDWEDLKEKSYFKDFKDIKLSVGAYDYTHNIYDPACNTDGWEKDRGITHAAKLIARMILTNLSLPVEDMYDYVIFNGDGYRGGANSLTGPDECWRSTDMSNIFDRVSGTGILDGIDEPTQYKLNAVGVATMTLAKNLSISSPCVTSAESEIDGLFVKLFTDKDDNKILAVWRQDTTEYAADYMDYISGHRDDGDTRKVLVDVDLKNISATTATRIPLDGTASSDLSVDGTTIKDVLLDGDMPVLIHLQP